MADKRIKELIRRRGVLKDKVTVFSAYVTNFDAETGLDQLSLRLEKLEETWHAFETVQGELEVIDEEDGHDEQHAGERTQFEKSYYESKSAAMKIIREKTLPPSVSNASASDSSLAPASTPAYKPNVKLPALNLKTFSGNYEEWLEFSDTFTGSIDKYPGLPPVHKLYYLRSCLTGKAAEIIKSLESTDENYKTAWNLLKENYESKRLIVQKHVKILYELPAVTRESAVELHTLYNSAQGHIRALKSMGQTTDEWGALLLHLMTSKLDRATLKAWERKVNGAAVPTLVAFWDFLNEHCQMLEAMSIDSSTNLKSQNKSSHQPKSSQAHHACVATSSGKSACFACNQQHNIQSCEKFGSMTCSQRSDVVKKSRVCFNCLRYGHVVSACTVSRCRKCDRKHHTLLHDDSISESAVDLANQPNKSTAALQAFIASQILLTTAEVDFVDVNGKHHACRILLDSGSQANFMTAALAHKLGMRQQDVKIPVSGFSDALTYVKGAVKSVIKSRRSIYTVQLKFLVTPKIVGKLPTKQVDTSALNIPGNVPLADPRFHRPDTVDALLGAEVFCQLLCVGQIRLTETAVLQKTQLGWIVAGNAGNASKMQDNATVCNLATASLETQVKNSGSWSKYLYRVIFRRRKNHVSSTF